jgi:putative component of membrane protein insertase Oxa1/YidC/SpoIIIJ protein YidD
MINLIRDRCLTTGVSRFRDESDVDYRTAPNITYCSLSTPFDNMGNIRIFFWEDFFLSVDTRKIYLNRYRRRSATTPKYKDFQLFYGGGRSVEKLFPNLLSLELKKYRSPMNRTPMDLLSPRIIDAIAVGAIGGYQRYLSPHKGFSCAHRLLYRGESCSQYTKRVIREEGWQVAHRQLKLRLVECKAADRILKSRQQLMFAAPPPTEETDETEAKPPNRYRRRKRDDAVQCGNFGCDVCGEVGSVLSSCGDCGDCGSCGGD